MGIRARLVLASFLMLFLELALIRWTGANVLHLSFFSNFVLLGSFLGIGLGFLKTRPGAPARPYYSPIALLALTGFVLAHPVVVEREGSDIIFFTSLAPEGPPIWITLPAIFLATAAIMAGPGELVAECFHQLPRLDAYRFDLIGSLLGIAAFTGLAYTGAPSAVWGIVVGALFLVLLAPPARGLAIAAGLGLVALLYGESAAAFLDDNETITWSPYYKIRTEEFADSEGRPSYDIRVNGIPHQRVTATEVREQQEPQYVLPYQRIPRAPEDVLIIGAGTGTDVAIALRHGAQHVDAVEIDPRLARLGEEHNPDRPYDDPRVSVHVDDGRAFLERTDRDYDLILFALPDSLTLVSGASSLRLESYLFTEQAIEAAREHLAPGGAFSMYNFYREAWLVDRLAGTLDAAFGHPPCVDREQARGQQAVMVAGLTTADQRCEQEWVRTEGVPAPATDDRPFLYLRDGSIPGLYTAALGLILLASLLAVRLVSRAPIARMTPYRDLFLLGAAFLLLETKSVTGFALLFGTTWVVNALVFGGVLLAVLAAVEVTRRFATPRLPVMYGILLGGLALAWLVPAAWLLGMPVAPRAAAAVTIAFLPIFAANVIFAKRFAQTPEPTVAFGANLLGAMVGGCLEYLALVVGYNALLIVAAVLYVGAYVVRPRGAGALGATARGVIPAAASVAVNPG